MQDVRSQLNDLNERLQTGYEDIKNLSEETISLVDKVESQLISPKQKTFQDVINFRNQLDAQFLDLLNTVNGNIPPLLRVSWRDLMTCILTGSQLRKHMMRF